MTFTYRMANIYRERERNCKGVLLKITIEKAGDYWVCKTSEVEIKHQSNAYIYRCYTQAQNLVSLINALHVEKHSSIDQS